MAVVFYANTMKVTHSGSDYRFWTGNGPLVYEDARWVGSYGLIMVGVAETDTSGPSNRLQAVINPRVTMEVLDLLRQDLGPAPVEVQWIVSYDRGRSWDRILLYRGRMSSQRFDSNSQTYTFEVETEDGTRNRHEANFYSDAVQRSDYPNDSGFSQLKQLAEGIEILWPS